MKVFNEKFSVQWNKAENKMKYLVLNPKGYCSAILDIPKSRRTKETKMAGYAQTPTNS